MQVVRGSIIPILTKRNMRKKLLTESGINKFWYCRVPAVSTILVRHLPAGMPAVEHLWQCQSVCASRIVHAGLKTRWDCW